MNLRPGMRDIKADLQNYLKSRSNVSNLDFKTLLTKASHRLGYGGIVGITTFHDLRYEDALRGCAKAGFPVRNLDNAFHFQESDLLFVKCQRVMTEEGDLDVIGLRENRHIWEHMSLEDTLKAIEDEGALSDVPAPFHRRGLGPFLREHPGYLERIHAITVYSGEAALWIPYLVPKGCTENPNKQALGFYQEVKKDFPHLGAITASNGSLVRHVGTNATFMYMPRYFTLKNSEDVTKAIREALPETSPEQARSEPLYLGAMRHQAVVLLDHNPISYRLRGVPNSDLDQLFTKK